MQADYLRVPALIASIFAWVVAGLTVLSALSFAWWLVSYSPPWATFSFLVLVINLITQSQREGISMVSAIEWALEAAAPRVLT